MHPTLYLNTYYYISKIIVIFFLNFLIVVSLFKNDRSGWISRAINFYILRTFDCYDFVSDIYEPLNVQDDIRDATRYTEMEKRVYRLQSNRLSRRVLLYGESASFGDHGDGMGLTFSI